MIKIKDKNIPLSFHSFSSFIISNTTGPVNEKDSNNLYYCAQVFFILHHHIFFIYIQYYIYIIYLTKQFITNILNVIKMFDKTIKQNTKTKQFITNILSVFKIQDKKIKQYDNYAAVCSIRKGPVLSEEKQKASFCVSLVAVPIRRRNVKYNKHPDVR